MQSPWAWQQPGQSQRSVVFGRRMVATSVPIAAQVGLQVLDAGGSAVDAAVATAAALTVVEPCSNGLGSDAFAMVFDGKELHGLNASGRSPQAWTADRFAGHQRMPRHGWEAVTVPGAISAWSRLHARWGRLPFSTCLAGAIRLARDGFPVSPWVGKRWRSAEQVQDAAFRQTFLRDGRAPAIGQIMSLPDHAQTLQALADSGGQDFYTGNVAAQIVAAAQAAGAALSSEDLATHQAEWVTPLHLDLRASGSVDLAACADACRVHELPPNGQGFAVLLALGILQETDFMQAPADSALAVHGQLEAMKIALQHTHALVADPVCLDEDLSCYLRPQRLQQWADAISDQALAPAPGSIPGSDTVYLCTADDRGQMVSFIQSNYEGFGARVVVPATGIAMQNRAYGFSLDPGHPNVVAGGKRPFHTIIPGFLTAANQRCAFGHMGGPVQAQGHLQFLLRTLLWGMDPQMAIDGPRWFVDADGTVYLEEGYLHLRDELSARGHSVAEGQPRFGFGAAQAIWQLPDGVYAGASESRRDGQVAASC